MPDIYGAHLFQDSPNLGESIIAFVGLPYHDRPDSSGDILRFRDNRPHDARVITIQRVDAEGNGPVSIDGIPYAEVNPMGQGLWYPCVFSLDQARSMAQRFDAELRVL